MALSGAVTPAHFNQPAFAPINLNPRQDAARATRRELTRDEEEEIRYAFDTMDTEHVGSVTRRQLKIALRALGFPVKKPDVLEMLRAHGEDRNERVDWDAFKLIVGEKLSGRAPMEDMHRAFQLFDIHQTGKIDLHSLRKLIKGLNMDIPDKELADMIHEFDLDKDGAINEAEFMAIMHASED